MNISEITVSIFIFFSGSRIRFSILMICRRGGIQFHLYERILEVFNVQKELTTKVCI